MKYCVLASGSEGNCVLVEDSNGVAILVDAGISMRRISDCLNQVGRDIAGIKAMVISHEHSDHLRGAAVIARRKDVPIYASEGTISLIKRHLPDYTRFISLNGCTLEFGDMKIKAFPVSHDASETHGFVITEGDERLVIATDLGHVDMVTLDNLRDSDTLILESNHDVDMLLNGPYPWDLKQRIRGQAGHLSNEQAAEALTKVAAPRLKRVVLAHLSKHNNMPRIAYDCIKSQLRDNGHDHIDVVVASQNNPTQLFEV